MTDSSFFIDLVLWLVYLLLAATAAAAVWSAVNGVRTHEPAVDPIAARYTSATGYVTAGGVFLVLLLSYLLGASQPVISNGRPFTDAFWLRLTDMFIYSTVILISVCSVIVAIAKFRR